MSSELDVTRVLGARAAEIIASIDDSGIQQRVLASAHACAVALETIGTIDLARFEKLQLNAKDLSLWRAASPAVRTLTRAVKVAVAEVEARFPDSAAPGAAAVADDLDAAFDAPLTERAFEQTRDRLTLSIDEMVTRPPEPSDDAIGEMTRVLISMMRDDYRRLGKRLTNPRVIGDRWNLLAELQELRDRSTRFLEAAAVTILGAFCRESPEELLPRYRSDAARAATLRAALADLRLEVGQLGSLLEHAEVPAMRGLCRTLQQLLDRFAATSVYGYLRALDKRQFILFGIELEAWEGDGGQPAKLRDALEGFSTFLEVMRGINRRVEVISRDRACLDAAHAAYIEGEEVPAVADRLKQIYGRDDDLDRWIRAVLKRESGVAIPVGMFERLKAELAQAAAPSF